jgi:enamine deaminase RidA (YjgF/YER057c/UK114 family)
VNVLEKLARRGLVLPSPPQPGGNYVSARRHETLLFLAGAISLHEGKVITGRLGEDLSIEQGCFAAQCCVLQQLAIIQQALGDFDRVAGIISLNGYVRCTPDFADPPLVINGASDLLVELWGDAGRHTRAAVGVASLPKRAAVEIQMVVELREVS